MPAYVPTTTDEENVAESRIVMGGVNVWLQEHVPLFRRTPTWLDRLLDAPPRDSARGKRRSAPDPAAAQRTLFD